jgi:TRAP-type mannitol/chloroaromatic compound transport system permease small subunit
VADANDKGNEEERERLNRELIELLNELRVALPGIQVLFAFLLIVPFSQGWRQVTEAQRDVYFAAVLCATAATILLIAPTAIHRIQWRTHDKEWMLNASNWLAIAGTVFLALAVVAVVWLITDVLFAGWAVAAVTAATAGLIAALWYALPLARRLRS